MSKVMKEKLLIIGASGHGKVVADIALKMNKWQRIAFLDDNESLKNSLGLEVLGTSKDIGAYINEWDIFVAIGNNSTREKIQVELQAQRATFPTLTHPQATIGEEVEIAEGTVVMAGVIINSSTKIGRGCIINTGSTVDHDSLIEEFVHISPGAHLAGNIIIRRQSWIGIGSVISNNIKIAEYCIIGAGTVIIKNISESGTYVGSPARRIR